MKKALLVLLVLSAVLSLAACHKHSYDMDYYVYDATHHWHQPTCKHQEERADKETHTFDADGICTVCQYDSCPYVMKLDYYGTHYRIDGLKGEVSGEITLPNTYKGLPVKEISLYAFTEPKFVGEITKVIIPDNYEIIGSHSFPDIHSLKSVVIGNGVKQISPGAFEGCINLESVTFGNSVEAIYAEAFQDCEKLDNVILPDSLKEITYRAFAYCKSLSSIVIPRGVTEILADAFYENDSLTDIYCEIEAQPDTWNPEWCGNYEDHMANRDVNITFGYTEK